MSDELEIAERFIVDTLLGTPSITDLVNDRVFTDPPPRGTLYPYILVSSADSTDVRGVGVQRIMSDTIVTVKAVKEGPNTEALGDLCKLIDGAITLEQPTDVGVDGIALSCVRERSMKYTETTNGTKYTHRGGEYRIHTQLN